MEQYAYLLILAEKPLENTKQKRAEFINLRLGTCCIEHLSAVHNGA